MIDTDGLLFIVVSGCPYHGVRQAARGIADALSDRARVLFVDPARSFATARPDVPADQQPIRGRVIQESPTLFRLVPNAPVGKDRRGIRRITKRMMAHQIRSAAAGLDANRRVLFQQSAHHSVIGRVGEQMSIYHSSDNLTAGASLIGLKAPALARAEERAARAADIVLAVSPSLAERWTRIGIDAELFLNAVDASAFSNVAATSPAADVALPHPIAGVVGTLSERLDMDLLHAIADRMSLLLIGPESFRIDRSGFATLIDRPTVQWVGQVPFEALPSYYRLIDVALVPYTLSEFNQASCPLKALEYLAAGKPLVSTSLGAVEELEAPGIAFAASPDDFAAAALEQAAAGKSGDSVSQLKMFAAEHTWERRADRIMELVEVTDNSI